MRVVATSVPCLLVIGSLATCKSRDYNARGRGNLGDSVQSGTFFFGFGNDKWKLTLPSGEKIDILKYQVTPAEETKILALSKDPDAGFFRSLDEEPQELATQNGLLFGELLALRLYSGIGYLLIGDVLQGKRESNVWRDRPNITSDQVELFLKGALSGLKKMPTCSGGTTVYFGAALEEKLFLPSLAPGKEFSNANFVSTSLDRDVARQFASAAVRGSNSPFIFQIPCWKGRSIEKISAVTNEKEVLYPPRFPFIVKKVSSAEETLFGGMGRKFQVHLVQLEESN